MSFTNFSDIRAYIETSVVTAFSAVTPPVPVVFDNVGGEPPATEYVLLTIDYQTFTQPVLAIDQNGIEYITGNIQMAIYSPKGNGMKRIEELDYVAISVLNSMKRDDFSVGSVTGPVHVLSGDDPLALSNVSAPFHATVTGSAPAPVTTVDSLFGRTGDVAAEEGDYSIGELGDVSGTDPETGGVLEWNGNTWVPAPSVDSEDF